MKSKWNIYGLCTEPDQRRGLSGESEHSSELNFLSLESLAPTSSQALRVNQRHKGYDVRLVTNDNMMCTETTWQFAAINLGARHGPFFTGRQVRFNTGWDLFLNTVLWILTSCALKKTCLILCSISWAGQEDFTTLHPKSIQWSLKQNPKRLMAKFTLDKLWDKLLLDSLCCHTGTIQFHSPPQHVSSLDDLLIWNFLRNAHPLEKREKLG